MADTPSQLYRVLIESHVPPSVETIRSCFAHPGARKCDILNTKDGARWSFVTSKTHLMFAWIDYYEIILIYTKDNLSFMLRIMEPIHGQSLAYAVEAKDDWKLQQETNWEMGLPEQFEMMVRLSIKENPIKSVADAQVTGVLTMRNLIRDLPRFLY